jgi:1-acyl-sn-glycerol-3-phosphate acyltransferase
MGLYGIARMALNTFFRLYNRMHVCGSDRVPKEGGVIVAANHTSYLDPTVVGVSLRRRAVFLAKEELFQVPLLRYFVRSWSLPLNRGRPSHAVLKEAVLKLREGGLLVIFPEGGIVGEDGADAKRGVGMLARLSGARLLPAYIGGTGKALPPGSWLIRPSRVTVRFGEPVDLSPGDDREAASSVMESIARLRQEETSGK